MEEGSGPLGGEDGAQLLRGGAQDAVRQRELDLRVLGHTLTTKQYEILIKTESHASISL